ncbi:GGDEF domain-containing protein [Paenibacillus sp. GP183]|jgi:diguanylate cyclase (GGDEF)-like protein|uniref:GGDEF domain-containing protein n=1 Tax=Paenibacillus sp. GP183 TaxID=1882751 RepID=UPI00089AEB17|nr:GGDEF domain-containing protein [Paenibacillus sp. GP183]SED13608.1 diguanylate cyclase (GGDEF) domain-containing protein [Paenibacillus sp. GP183]
MGKWDSIPCLKDIHIQPGHTVDENESLGDFMDKIRTQKSSNRTYIVMRDTKPVGIIRSIDMFRLLGTLYGVALNYKKRLNEVMYSNILTVDWNMKIDEVSRKATVRIYEDIYDDIIVTRDQDFIGVIPVYELLTFMTEFKLREAVQQNPLTGLPGNERIHDYITIKIEQKEAISVIYTDIDHFKAYNDVYGFKYGDDVIRWVGRLLTSTEFKELSFVGHIGGDDFVTCLPTSSAEDYCEQVIKLFEIEKRNYYSLEDNSKNNIESLDRDHVIKKFPLISLSMAILNISSEQITDLSELSLKAARVKKQAKQINGSNYVNI